MTLRWGGPTVVAGAVGVVAASFLPVARSGAATRTTYEVVAAAERLEVLSGPLATLSLGWYLVPLVAAGAWIAVAAGARTIATLSSVMLFVASVALSVAIWRSPIAATWAATVPPTAGVVTLVGAVRREWEQRVDRRHEQGGDGRPFH